MAFQAWMLNARRCGNALACCGLYGVEVTPYSRHEQDTHPETMWITVLDSEQCLVEYSP